jgi:hypothetical protein
MAFPYLESARGNAYQAWKNFEERYNEVNENDLVELNDMFAERKIEDFKG